MSEVSTMKKIIIHDIQAYHTDANGDPELGPDEMIVQTRTVEQLFRVTDGVALAGCSDQDAIVDQLQYWTHNTKAPHVADIHHFLIARIRLPKQGKF